MTRPCKTTTVKKSELGQKIKQMQQFPVVSGILALFLMAMEIVEAVIRQLELASQLFNVSKMRAICRC